MKLASSIAESPPPTTTTVLSRKNAASHVAQYETPRPWRRALRLEAELAGGGARRDDHGLRAVLVVADPHAERPLREVDARHVVRQERRAESLRLAPEVLHHRRAEDTVGVPRVVLHVGGDHQLATPVEALDHERLEVRARGVERSGVAGGTSADHDQVADIVQGSAVLLCRVIPLMGETTTRSPVFQRSRGVRLAWKELRRLLGDELRSGEDTCLPLDGRQLRRRDPRDSVLLEAPRLGQHLPFERTDGLVERAHRRVERAPQLRDVLPPWSRAACRARVRGRRSAGRPPRSSPAASRSAPLAAAR